MKVRANGLSLPDLDTLAALETGRFWTPAKRPGEPLYRPAINNGYWAEDIITDGLVLYVPLWLYSGSKFPSVDAYKHTCTVTGATWGLQGRTFDGIDNKIGLNDNNESSALNFTSSNFTVGIWVKLDVVNIRQELVSRGYDFLDGWTCEVYNNFLAGRISQAAAQQVPSSTAGDVSAGVWCLLHFIRNGLRFTFYRNGLKLTNSADPDIINPASTATATQIGIFGNGIGSPLDGIAGEVCIYNRALTLLEIQHNYLATKWRYA